MFHHVATWGRLSSLGWMVLRDLKKDKMALLWTLGIGPYQAMPTLKIPVINCPPWWEMASASSGPSERATGRRRRIEKERAKERRRCLGIKEAIFFSLYFIFFFHFISYLRCIYLISEMQFLVFCASNFA